MKHSKRDTHSLQTRNHWSCVGVLLAALAVVGCTTTTPSGTREADRRAEQSGLNRYAPATDAAPVAR